MQIYIDIEPHEDKRLVVDRKFAELARIFTGFCQLCRTPTTHIHIWEPESKQHKLAAKVPKDKTRIFFFPICQSCASRDLADAELQWRTIETINVNVPLEDGHRYYH